MPWFPFGSLFGVGVNFCNYHCGFFCVFDCVHLQPKSPPKPYKMSYLNCHFALIAQCCILKQWKIPWADPTSLVQSTVIHWYFGFQSFSQEMQDLSAHGSEYKAWGPCRVLSPVPTATHNHVTEVKSKKAALHVILKYNSHSLQTAGFWMTVPEPYFIYRFNADISVSIAFCIGYFFQTTPRATEWVWHKRPITAHPSTGMNLSNVSFLI